ncbi:hypothetical protein RF11_09148 [Thelohanellus kitauei]|uniref:Tc1-like transposase DDE domain-containing protein n=1 Tax=Thelohanellus kitauei TaxID=669202 RepID=A0A0C2J036_THEKT|nr:hypothetical protein RF11_09148 [Thelohanellus kitauei]
MTKTENIILDNVRSYHVTEVHEVVESQGHQIFLITHYSSQLTSFKLLFSKLKSVEKSNMSILDRKYPIMNHLYSIESGCGNRLCRLDEGKKTLSSNPKLAYWPIIKQIIVEWINHCPWFPINKA